jgi:hypothetical protein
MRKPICTLLFLTIVLNAQTQFLASASSNGSACDQSSFNYNPGISDTVIKSNTLNFATLIVDYDTWVFEGGNLSYYQQCENCAEDSIPFEILVSYPGDFGSITYKIQNTLEIVFDATIIWMGTGQIYHPEYFSLSYPFNSINNQVVKPNNIEYYNIYGTKVYTDSAFIEAADSAWQKIESLTITKLFAENNYKTGIYLYPPYVGIFSPEAAKWIIFLYLNDYSSSTRSIHNIDPLFVYPNPCTTYLTIENRSSIIAGSLLEILDLSGKSLIRRQMEISTNSRMDVSSLKPGVYLLSILNHEFSYQSKFIKL